MAVEERGLIDGAGPGTHAASEAEQHMEHERVNHGLLAEPERRTLLWLAARTPAWVTPDHLTALGVTGAALSLVGFLCAQRSPYFVGVIVLGLFLNWYGDSLDGTLARYRRIERPLFGYFIDHSCDLISQTLIFIGLGLSPYFTLNAALFALSMYLLMSSYTYLKVLVLRTHHLSYGGMGATELRAVLAVWSIGACWIGFDPNATRVMGYAVLDVVIGGLWLVVFAGFIWMVRRDVAKFRQQLEQDRPTVKCAVR